jgi:MoxR-like ATPase
VCLQPILEGKGIFLKKIGRFVTPSPGFNVVATANTKGKGSDDGRFIGTNVLNEAFLERFPVTFEQDYPSPNIEKKILGRVAATVGITDIGFINHLVDWGDIIRKTFYDGGIDEIISTRRLVHILRAYSIFNDKMKAIQVCVNRFDDETKQSFLELYDKVDATVQLPVGEE